MTIQAVVIVRQSALVLLENMMLKKTKRLLYRDGKYSCRVPPGDTTKWSVDQWCEWIDEHGTWWK